MNAFQKTLTGKEFQYSNSVMVQVMAVDSFTLYVLLDNQQITFTIANDERREQLRRENVKQHASAQSTTQKTPREYLMKCFLQVKKITGLAIV